MRAYAAGTSVSVEKTRGEIEALISGYGADQFVTGWSEAEHAAMVQFKAQGRFVKITFKLPVKTEKRFTRQPKRTWLERKPKQRDAAWDAEVRRVWRAVLLVIKSKLESVRSGIESFEQAFLPWILLPDGSTVGRAVTPLIETAYTDGKMPKMLMLGPGSDK